MTNNNNNNGFIPQNLNNKLTATVAYYNAETDQNLTQEEWRALKTSSDQVQVVNRGEGYQSEKALNIEPSYGPCSYSGCPYDTEFWVEIYIEGCKWWARKPGEGTSLPGNWEESFTGKYYWRDDLWLNHVGHARDADNLIGRDKL